jgi:predicted Fe-S protein YdhL (DUF1289 family)
MCGELRVINFSRCLLRQHRQECLCHTGSINVAQTLLSVPVRLGMAEKITAARLTTLLLLLMILACHRTNIDRAQWQSMPPNEKALYVRTLLGHEKTKDAKGGNDRVFTRSIDEYVKEIDDAYARGDTRTADAIFETMGSRR